MRILMVARRFPPDVRSGTETVFENLWRQARARHEVRLLVGYRRERGFVPEEAVAVDLRGVSRAAAWGRLWWAARQENARFKPDVVLANSIEAPAGQVPTACIVHDLNFGVGDRSAGTLAREGFYALKSRRLGAVITVSEASRQRLLTAGMPNERLHVIHNGVDLARFCPRQRPSDGLFRFAYPSRILPSKGQHIALDAFARLPARFKERARLTIVGAVDDTIYLDQLRVQAWGLPVDFFTDVPDIAPYYQDADAILFPSMMEEGFGFTAVEGMACGKPVIAFDQPAVREATAGLAALVPRGDADAMRDAMRALMESPDKVRAQGAANRLYCEEHYDWGQVWERYEAVLRGMHR